MSGTFECQYGIKQNEGISLWTRVPAEAATLLVQTATC